MHLMKRYREKITKDYLGEARPNKNIAFTWILFVEEREFNNCNSAFESITVSDDFFWVFCSFGTVTR